MRQFGVSQARLPAKIILSLFSKAIFG